MAGRRSMAVGLWLTLLLSVSGTVPARASAPIQAALPPVTDDLGRLADDFFRWLAGRAGSTRVLLPTLVGTLDDIALRPRLVLMAQQLGIATDDLIGLLKVVQSRGGYAADEVLRQVDSVTGEIMPRLRLGLVRDSVSGTLGAYAPGFVTGMVCGVADTVLENGRWLTPEEVAGVAIEELLSLGFSEVLGAFFEIQDAANELYDITVADVPGSVTDDRLRLWLRCLQVSHP